MTIYQCIEDHLLGDAVKEFESGIKLFRFSDDECYDRTRTHNTNQSGDQYSYIHWGLHDVCQNAETALTELFYICYDKAITEDPFLKSKRLGDCVLRVLKYSHDKPFGAHYDINYRTFVLGSVDTQGKGYYSGKIHHGLQTELMGDGKVTLHKFNPKSHNYSLVFFINLHYSTRMNNGVTIGEYLERHCYG